MAEQIKIERYYAFPDIHGCMKLFQKALDFVYAENPSGGKIIFLGDYIDRGPNNKEVLETVMNPKDRWEHICLMGNHEQMFLECFDNEDFRYCYDPNVIKEFLGDKTYSLANIKQYFPTEVLNWMRNLKYFHFEDDNVFAHAYYDPDLSEENQNLSSCVWSRMDDWQSYQSHLFLTHGHTPRKHGPVSSPNRLNLDIGIHHYNQYAIAEYEVGKKGPVKLHRFE